MVTPKVPLPSTELDRIWADVMRDFSRRRIPIPVTKDALKTLMSQLDGQTDTFEGDSVRNLPAGGGKTWLASDEDAKRRVLAALQETRRDVL